MSTIGSGLRLTPRAVAPSVQTLLERANRREEHRPADARSGARFERVEIDGAPHLLKYVHADDDFAMRHLGDLGGIPLRLWSSGLMDAAADVIDHAVVGVAGGHGRNGWGAAILMRDMSDQLVPVGDTPIPEPQHLAFLDHLAALSARMWGWQDTVGLVPFEARWTMFAPDSLAAEHDLGWPEPVPRHAQRGWQLFDERAPRDVAATIDALRRDSAPLVEALARTPQTFLHGDWKLGNLGSAADGRTILLDWAYPGAGPVCHELGWYLALNRARLPVGHSKERAVGDFRAALERHGVDCAGWWDQQLSLALLGTVVQFGWEKALGDDAELGWWCDRVREGAVRL